MSMSERLKKVCDEYINGCFPDKLPPRQEIEIRLAFYGGMMACFQESAKIANEHEEDESMLEMQEFSDALMKRALDLNRERRGL